MKQVWKCDHCSHTSIESELVNTHEISCSFNPSTKSCWTCEHNEDEGMPISGSMYVCQIGVNMSDKDEIESSGHCKKWELELDC